MAGMLHKCQGEERFAFDIEAHIVVEGPGLNE